MGKRDRDQVVAALRYHAQHAETEEQRRAAASALDDIEIMESRTKPGSDDALMQDFFGDVPETGDKSVRLFEPPQDDKPSGIVAWLAIGVVSTLLGLVLSWWVLT